jgi:ABC-type lipoprotein export system ATPase subunit
MFHTSSLTFSYDSNRVFQYPPLAFTDVKQPLLITGRSGAGKTTLLHLLSGILRPHSGHIYINQTDIVQLENKQLDVFRGRHIGMVFQRPHFIPSISIANNLMLPLRWGQHRADAIEKIKAMATHLQIAHTLESKPSKLSQGELQRAAIARALINKPTLVLADEPTSALDDENCKHAIQLLLQQCTISGSHLVVVTHDSRLTNMFSQHIHLS